MKEYEEYKENKEYKEHDGVLRALKEGRKLQADSRFKAEARVRLMDAVTAEQPSAKVIRIRPRRLVIRTMAAVAALSLVMTGVGFASSDSVPGDALYPVKRSIEEARLRTTTNNESKANLYLEIAGKRLAESERLKSLNRRDCIEATLKLMSGNFAQAQALMNKVPAARRIVILKRIEQKKAQAEIRRQRVIEKKQEQLNKQPQQPKQPGQPEKQNLKLETKQEHIKSSNGNGKKK